MQCVCLDDVHFAIEKGFEVDDQSAREERGDVWPGVYQKVDIAVRLLVAPRK